MVSKIEVGKIYKTAGLAPDLTWEVLHIHDDKIMRKRSTKYSTEFDVVDMINISGWEEIKAKKILYCSIWTQASKYTWSIAEMNKISYDRTKNHYKACQYTMIKEWELEYEAP